MHAATRRAEILEAELRVALSNDQLVLHYQPQLDIAGETVLAAEALVRWQHPERGLLLPREFIPVAESSGLIVDLGNWAIGEACAQALRWRAAGLPPLRVAVNISPRQFKSRDLVTVVDNALRTSGLEPQLLELEITESMVMHDLDHAMKRLGEIRELGVEIAIDDFGTGYSSLARLKRFPVQRLKIDRSFVSKLRSGSAESAIVESVIRLGHGLGVKVVAEGIETARELAVLRDLGCDEAQGFYFCKPADANEIHDWLVAWHPSDAEELADAPA